MLEKLKQRWKVNTLNLVLIIATFALGGSLCGYAGRKILQFTNINKGVLYVVLYIMVLTLLWPLAVLVISIPLGQFNFFRRYLHRISKRVSNRGQAVSQKQSPSKQQEETGSIQPSTFNSILSGAEGQPHPERGRRATYNLALFASGAGSNAKKIIDYFATSDKVNIALVVCNRPGAGVLDIALKAGIPSILITRTDFANGDAVLTRLQQYHIDFIVLTGFLLKVPEAVIKAYPKKIVNIHPALLPKYGGKGMYGHFVHESVIANKDAESGITIHYADEVYDHGEIILQARCPVTPADTADTLAQKIHQLEHAHYAPEIEKLLQ